MSDERGFAMADALVALTVMSALLTALLGVNDTSLNASQKADARLTATLIAQAVLEDRSIRESDGMFAVDTRAYHWRRDIKPHRTDRTDSVALDDIAVTVQWQVKTGQNQITLSSSKWRVLHNE